MAKKRFHSDREMLEYLFSRRRMSIKLGLENINHLMDVLGRPEKSLVAIHVAGTNGKGSTCAMLESIYRNAGYKTGLYTSPHLVDVRERIRVNGEKIPPAVLREGIETLYSTIERYGCSFFEILTAMAFAYFREERVDIAIVETGLGGRLDATNVLFPEISVITEIDIDHVKQLGDTPPQIAREKAGIIKENTPVLSIASNPEARTIFRGICTEKQSPFIDAFEDTRVESARCSREASRFNLITPENEWQNLWLPLLGKFQVHNAVAAVRTVETLAFNGNIESEAIQKGLRTVDWPGRLQIVQRSPLVVVDVAHNNQGIQTAMEEIVRLFAYKKLICVFGILADKDAEKMIEILTPNVDYFVSVTPENERALPAEELAEKIAVTGKPVWACPSIAEGLRQALSQAEGDDLVCVLGSHFVVGKILQIYKNP